MDETITVQVFEALTSVAITVYFKEPTGEAQDIISSQKYTVELNQTNNFTRVILAQVLPEKTKHLNFARTAQYAILVAEIPLEKTREAQIRLSSRPYFIYIMTDKPIYTPDETVQYQIFTLDQVLNPINSTVIVEVLDSQGTVLASVSEQYGSNSMHSGEITIKSEMPGNYQIRAKVCENSEYQGLISFRVQNYEFPKFDVRIFPDPWYYVVTDENFPFTIQVLDKLDNDLHGNVTFGMCTTSGDRIPLPQLHQVHRIQDGTVRVILNSSALIDSINQNGGMDKFKRGTLYIVAEITDEKGHTEAKVLDNISFRQSPYDIDLSAIKPYFIPGTAFQLLISVTYPDGSPASDVPLNVSLSIAGEKVVNVSSEGLTDQIGELGFTLNVPWNTQDININVSVGNHSTGYEQMHKAVKKYYSASKRYLHIKVPHALLYPGDTITVKLTAISQESIHNVHYYYYMVLSKSKVLDFRRVEWTPETAFELPITRDMIPHFRIVAYYILIDDGGEEIIADYLQVEVGSLCDIKFQVDSAFHQHGKSHELLLTVLSESPAKVFVQAMDTRLKELNTQDTITMRKVFEDLNSYDFASSHGSGNNTLGIFHDSGLYPFFNLKTKPSESTGSGPRSIVIRQKEQEEHGIDVHVDVTHSTFNDSSVSKLDTVPRNETFRLISNTQPPSSKVLQAFNESAKDGSGQKTVTIRPRELQTHRAGVPSHPIRPTFNGSFLWSLNAVANNETFRLISDFYPSRAWEIQALRLSVEDGLCLAQHKVLILDGGHSIPMISTIEQPMGSRKHPLKKNHDVD
ncbi:complement C3-like isoform X2 [Carcharodon carcharias]|uniref:complement C3-like isoform X2 n=1 Tax=Carcharodon carcharias TaxID=13397 RepID=UPI001B7F059D|nr:complement C3-like isoform X2 [Carcharodon carcharias]